MSFDVSPRGLIALHAGGVAEAVLNRMINAGTREKLAASFGVATGAFPVKDAVGRTVHYSASIKTENVRNGYAGLWWQVDGEEKGKVLHRRRARQRQRRHSRATGSTGWTRYEFELPVAARARNHGQRFLYGRQRIQQHDLLDWQPKFEDAIYRGWRRGQIDGPVAPVVSPRLRSMIGIRGDSRVRPDSAKLI